MLRLGGESEGTVDELSFHTLVAGDVDGGGRHGPLVLWHSSPEQSLDSDLQVPSLQSVGPWGPPLERVQEAGSKSQSQALLQLCPH